MESNTPTFKMTEAELIRELTRLEALIDELTPQLVTREIHVNNRLELSRALIRVVFLREELESRTLSASI